MPTNAQQCFLTAQSIEVEASAGLPEACPSLEDLLLKAHL